MGTPTMFLLDIKGIIIEKIVELLIGIFLFLTVSIFFVLIISLILCNVNYILGIFFQSITNFIFCLNYFLSLYLVFI